MSNKKAILKLEDGREIEVEISDEVLERIKRKRSPYEAVKKGEEYFFIRNSGKIATSFNKCLPFDLERLVNCNYYNDKNTAERDARADLLMRKLRKFAIENNLLKDNKREVLFEIVYDKDTKELTTAPSFHANCLGAMFNDTSIAEKAIDEYHDELLWYFEEYHKIFI